jgi:hypothetical protein
MAKMTPLEFSQLYLSMSAYIFPPEPSVTPDYPLREGVWWLRVAQYRLTKTAWAATFWADIRKHLPKMVDVRVRPFESGPDGWEDVTLTQDDAWGHFHWPFGGKGTPEDAQIAIQLLYRYHKTSIPPDHFVEAPGFIGLDCSGFVGSYVQRVVHEQTWQEAKDKDDLPFGGADDGIGEIFNGAKDAPGGGEMKHLEDLVSEDTYILALCDGGDGKIKEPDGHGHYGHIMLTEPNTMSPGVYGTAPARLVRVVQASGSFGELHSSNYFLHSPGNKSHGTVFTLSGETEMPVRVARLKV